MNSKITEIQEQINNLKTRRSPREKIWRELKKWICPWRGRFDDAGTPYDRDEEELALFTGAAGQSVLRGASGMTSGMTPRAAAWFKPEFEEEWMREADGARAWLDRLDGRIKDCLAEGGFYQAIQIFNADLLWSGCALLYSEAEGAGMRYESIQTGTYCVALNNAGSLEAVARTLLMTASDLERCFGRENMSEAARGKLAKNPWEPLRIVHFVRRRGERIESWWLEENARDKALREATFFEMPYFFAVWNEGATPYGTGPGDEVLADARQMDLLERNKLAALGKLADPPVVAHPSLKDSMDLEPGGITFANENLRLAPLLDLGPAAQAMRPIQEEIQTVRERLDIGLMASIFSSIPLDQRPRDMSATEFLERKRESLQQLGPVISAYEPNVLVPCLARTMGALYRAGRFPKVPDSLKGVFLPMKIEFVSPLANALRQTTAESARALFQDAAAMAQASGNPEIFDKLNLDQIIDELATGMGAPGSIVRSDDETAQIRQQRAARQEEERQMAQLREIMAKG